MAERSSQSASAVPPGEARNTRYGLWFFLVYVILYGGFVGLSAFEPEVMARTPLGGVNLAILCGFGLIIAAFALALTYAILCAWAGDDRAGAGAEGGR
jgi:uncharacterized membrane protein (DUF485 family)